MKIEGRDLVDLSDLSTYLDKTTRLLDANRRAKVRITYKHKHFLTK